MKITQDAALGTVFVAVGLGAFAIALGYPPGTAGRMGPGYFPVIVSALLALTGAAILLRAWVAASGTIAVTRFMPLIAVPVSIVIFGLLIEKLGLPLAVLVLSVGAATASIRFRLGARPLAGAVAFAACCGILFVELLGLPIPLAGTWLQAIGF